MRIAIGSAAISLAAGAVRAQPWPQFARDASRSGSVEASPSQLGQPRWVLSQIGGQPITFVGQASVATDGLRVYASGRVNSQHRLLAISQESGSVDWWTPLSAAFVDSWSSPAVDLPRGIVLAASGRYVTALDLGMGAVRWQTELPRNVVNASPLVVSELGRAFITDYDGFGTDASLYCINLLPQSASQPLAPGAIVWSVPIGGSSGNSPTYADGKVFVAAARQLAGGDAGAIYAFPAEAAAAPQPLWSFTNVQQTGFFGGVAVRNGAVYAASYALYGGQLSANLVKVDAATGSLVWSVPSNRTDSTPLVLSDGRIVLSTGIMGFGSAPSIQFFGDGGASGSMLWDSALTTWNDINGNTVIDPGEFLNVGWWTNQPVLWDSPSGPRLWVGAVTPGTPSFGACTDLYLIDLNVGPPMPGFVVDHAIGAGSSPAVADGMLLSVGPGGLSAFGSPPCYANCDASTTTPVLNVADFTCFLQGFASGDPRANCDRSTVAPVLNVADFTCFLSRFAAGCLP
jgi:outer membrane protein assembly factor BamB